MGLRRAEYLALLVAGWMQWRFASKWLGDQPDRWRRAILWLSYIVLSFGLLLSIGRISVHLPGDMVAWARGAALAWAASLIFIICTGFVLASRFRPFNPGRRRLLLATRAAVCATPLVVAGFGVLVRKDFTLREIDIPIPGLPRDLQGVCLVQVSDIHLGPFLSEQELAYVIDMANETKAHVAVVTGDLITVRRDPLDACIRQLSRLKAEAGVVGCLGNHERYAEAEDYTTRECDRFGMAVLRNQSRRLKFGNAVLNLAGVDYQSMRNPYLVQAERLVSRQANHLNVLLSHNPDVFKVAARQGFQLTMAGHTHGGQVSVEILHKHLNVARFFTPYTYGLYREGRSAIYVTRGVGTVGIPARIGAPPEIALVRLCAS